VVEALQEHLAGRSIEPDGFVFALSNRGPLRTANFRTRVWRPATRAADLEGLCIHDLRHTAVALWIAAGAGPKEVASRAGQLCYPASSQVAPIRKCHKDGVNRRS
jgi:integrase